MQFDELALPINSTLTLAIVGQDYKRHACEARLIGYRRGHAIMVYLATKPGQVMLRQGQKVEGTVINSLGKADFISRIDLIYKEPTDYLVLAYPDGVDFAGQRREPRYAFDKAFELRAHTGLGMSAKAIHGKILDLSRHGACINTEKELTDIVRKISMQFTVRIGEVTKSLALDAVLRNTGNGSHRHPDSPFVYGIEFVDIDKETAFVLHALTMQLGMQDSALPAAGR